MKEKSELEKKLTTQDVLGKELCEFQGYIDKMKAESKDLKAQLTMKSDELSEQQELNEKMKNEHEKQLAKLNKQLETWKSKHEKVLEEKKPEAEGEGQEEESKEETKTEATANRPFDPEKDGKSWDSIDLAAMLM